MTLLVRVLGPLQVVVDDHSVALGGPKQQELLALLLVHLNQSRSMYALVDDLWADPPGQPARSIQVYVSALRKALGPYGGALHSTAGGYRLELTPGQLDATRFEHLLRDREVALRDGNLPRAREILDDALSLWRGDAYIGLGDGRIRAEANRLQERRLTALEWRLESDLGLGRHGEVLGELEGLALAHPYRERLQRQLMLGYYRTGRVADALAHYDRVRRTLADEIGLDPGAELNDLHLAILRQDAGLLVEPAEVRSRRHLPAPATKFVGRAAEIAAMVRQLASGEVRLLTLSGPGGIGKTRLALQVAHELAYAFVDGVYFVGLAPLVDADLVGYTIARALGVDETAGSSPFDATRDHLRERHTLLVCDNFEHVDEAAAIISDLLSAAPGLAVLVTSRVPLRLYGEHVHAVALLELEREAVPLFVSRAAATTGMGSPSHLTHPDQHRKVAEICERLDRLPLAIELAAARAADLALDEMVAMLARRLDLPTSGPRDLPARQRTLRAAIEWSVALLEPSERTLFAQLGVFASGFDTLAAEAVAAASPDGVSALVRNSLLVETVGPGGGAAGASRLSMLETIREYAIEQLHRTDSHTATRLAHASYFVDLAERSEAGVRGPDQLDWMARVDADYDNVRAALGWLAEHAVVSQDREPRELRLRITAALGAFWYRSGRATEGAGWLTSALADSDDRPDLLRARALHSLGILEGMRADPVRARAAFEVSGEIFRQLGDVGRLARSLNSQGAIARDQGEVVEARKLLEESLPLYREAGERRGLAVVLSNLGIVARDARDFPRARALLEESLEIVEEQGDAWGVAAVTESLAVVSLEEGEHDDSRRLLGRSIDTYEDLGARIALMETIEVVAWLAAAVGEHSAAARLAGAAETQRAELGTPLTPNDISLLERFLAPARAAMGEDAFRAAWLVGTKLAVDEAVTAAREVTRAPAFPG